MKIHEIAAAAYRNELRRAGTYPPAVRNDTSLSKIIVLCGLSVFLSLFFSISSPAQDFIAKAIGDYGNVTVMEVTGNYDAVNPDRSINSAPREVIAREFFRTHKDEYDFLFVFSNFDFTMPESEAKAFYLGVRNDTRGIGLPVFDNSGFFGSNGKLQGMVDMGNISKFVVDPLDPQFEEVLHFLSHELMHRWGAYVKFRDANGNISAALLGRSGTHWNFLLDSKASVLYGNHWQDNANGTFTSIGARRYYSPLDLYLMGMLDKSQVPPMLLIQNPNIDPAKLPEVGVTIQGTARYVTIDDIVAAEGERIPSFSESQKSFRIGYVLVTTPGTFRGDEIYGIENVRRNWITRFSILTDGEGFVEDGVAPAEEVPTNPGIPAPPYTPRSIPPNIEDGVKWLMSHQGSDGSWMDMPQTTERDTVEAALILKNFDMAKGNYESGIQWLNTVPSRNMDYLSRKIEVLVQAGQDVKAWLDELVLRQNPDGGWGSNANYMSNPTDTSFALKAMAAEGTHAPNLISRAIEYLKSKQNPSGGWGGDDEESNIQSTANVLSAFNRFRKSFQLEEQISNGMAWLMSRRNPDGGFGNSPSTIYDTAIALSTLKELDGSTEVVKQGLNYLLNLQSDDGSWFGSPYQTALAVSAVWKATIDPDLSIKTDDITFTPPSVVSLPANVTLDATIWNSGRSDVPQAKVVLYDRAPTEANKLAEQVLGFPGQSSVRVSFPVVIDDGNEHRFYLSVDPENLVRESNESNNMALKILYPTPTYDFEILPSDISISPNPVDIFRAVKISSKITNRGTMNAYNLQVGYYIDEAGGRTDIATVTLDIPAGSAITKEIIWRADKAGIDLPLTVSADPFNLFEEVSEANNQASASLSVNGSTDPNLTILYQNLVITPSPALERGSATISARVSNNGFSAASDINVNFYKGIPGKDGVLIGSQTIPVLQPGETKELTINWTNINASGEKVIYVQVDPDSLIREVTKEDNTAFVTLKILSLPDLVISTNSILFNPSAPKEGDTVAIKVTVQNRGEQNAPNVLVRAYEGNQVIGSQALSLIPGNSQGVASIAFDTTGRSGPHRILVQVDPENLIVEQSEDNNEATRDFGVQDANLWVTEKYISPNGDGIKDSTQFFFRLNSAETVKIAVVDKNGKAIRTFSGNQFENTTGGAITWDGLDDFGRVVRDGRYQIEILDEHGNSIGSLLVVVDNNRSPLTEAFGTKYLLERNLTCMVPSQASIGSGTWHGNPYGWGGWFPDDSGIALNIGFDVYKPLRLDPAFPPGYYFVSNDGSEINRMVPWEWTKGIDPVFDYYTRLEISPDGEKVAYTVNKWNKRAERNVFFQIWVGDKDGRNLTLLDSFESAEDGSRDYYVYGSSWSPNGQYIAYSVVNGHLEYDPWWRRYYRVDDYEDLWIIKADGTGKTKIATVDMSGNHAYLYGFGWSRDSEMMAFVQGGYDDQDQKYEHTLFVSDRSANKRKILTSEDDLGLLGWFNNQKIIVEEESKIWLIDPTEPGSRVQLSENFYYSFTFSPDYRKIHFGERIDDKMLVKGFNEDGNLLFLYETPASHLMSSFVWSPDSTKIAYVDYAYQRVTDCDYIGYVIVQDLKSGEKKVFKGLPVNLCYVLPPETSYFLFPNVLSWLPDNYSVLVEKSLNDTYVLDSETGEEKKLPIGADQLTGLSALGRFMTYYKESGVLSACYQREYNDVWVMSSLLNLTADLRVTKGKSEILLKGTAADLNFEGYTLEYADIKDPKGWYPVGPPSDAPVINDRLGTWVPPYEGIFYLRLTVWDQAGNAVQERKRISWGLSASITNLYKSLEVFSPNGDGVRDWVELHYRVLEPVHLEFYVYDKNNHLKKVFYRNYAFPVEDYIRWDGRDEAGSLVPDGRYKIKVYDYEFFVEVDTTPPDVNLRLGAIQQDEKTEALHISLEGHAFDENIKGWVVEYGEGENPQAWYELKKGNDLLVGKDLEGNPVLSPVMDAMIDDFFGSRIAWVTGKKFKITAEDLAGNRGTRVTDFVEEVLVLYAWDYQTVPLEKDREGHFKYGIIPATRVRAGVHFLEGLETFRIPIDRLNVQYWENGQWLDAPARVDSSSGIIHLEWDTSAEASRERAAVRIKAVDLLGQAHYSNPLLPKSSFAIWTQCDHDGLEAVNSLFEKLNVLRFQVQTNLDATDPQWRDYLVLDSEKEDVIPEGQFAPPLPPNPPLAKFMIRMMGVGTSGEAYESLTHYPPDCPIQMFLNVSYHEAECGLISDRARLTAEMKNFGLGNFSFNSLSYHIQKPEGIQLLRQFDLKREGWGSVEIDTLTMPEGSYPVTVVLSYTDFFDYIDREVLATTNLVVDRVLPTARMTYPRESLMLCPVKASGPKGNWYGIPVEGLVADNREVKEFMVSYGIGENPLKWMPAMTQKRGKPSPILGKSSVQGQLGLWDVTDLRGTTYSLKLKVVDAAGNVTCDTTRFSFDSLMDIVYLSTDKPLFSPNADGFLDEVEITYKIDEYAAVDLNVFKLIKGEDGLEILDASPVRRLMTGLIHIGGTEKASWDGMDESGAAVPDGRYGVAVFAKDSCGNASLRWTPVEVDNTPPDTAIITPAPADPLGIIAEIRGTADDPNFQGYLLEAGEGEDPDTWAYISSNIRPVKEEILGQWNTFGLEGRWTLRLTAMDRGGNRNETKVIIDLGLRKRLIKDLNVLPNLFSPNRDGKLDTATINYELTEACEVRINIFDLTRRSMKTSVATIPSAGTYAFIWDGTDEEGLIVPDGTYTIKLMVALASNASVTQSEEVSVRVDSTPPIVSIQQPLNNSYSANTVVVAGTISDQNILEYAISYTGDGGAAVLDKAYQKKENHTFAILNGLPDGTYTLHAEAKDLGGNSTKKTIVFTIDTTPPRVSLDTPKEGEYYGSEENRVDISGAIVERNLETYSLRYGSGDRPSQWTELLGGHTLPGQPQLLSWDVGKNGGIPDGTYTVSLYARDKAGLTAEGQAKIIIDNTVPEVLITSPKSGSYVKASTEIRGTASDANLEKSTLDISEGQCPHAVKWTPLATATVSIRDAMLAKWQALPPDGDYCVRLTAVDKVGNKGEVRVDVRVNATPPAAPVLSGKIENKADVQLDWSQNKEPDLAGYNIYRDGQKVNTDLIAGLSFLDRSLKQGIYVYTVKAVDQAANESKPSNEIRLRVDDTGPDARIISPHDGATVSGFADIKGTAYSSDDFKQYRVLVGQGTSPSAWDLIRTSPLPILSGLLVQWNTFGFSEGPYSIRLEAEDLTGNLNAHQIVVSVDNTPPAAPVWISAVPNNSEVTLMWRGNSEADLSGYLLFRDEQLVNASVMVIGNLNPYLIVGTSYVDKGLPDGTFRYYLIAMDKAENMSGPSHVLEVNVDSRAPSAKIVAPADKSKFQERTLVKAESTDTDIVSIQFQYKRTEEATWLNLNDPVTKPPFTTNIDPITNGLTYGDYHLRALATDLGGQTDPSPPYITLTYMDIIPPSAPRDLKVLANGTDVRVTWQAPPESDLNGYSLYRTSGGTKIKVNSALIKETEYHESSLPDGTYTYEVTALDTFDNESRPSNSAIARVYAPIVEQPYTPTGQKVIQLNGKNIEPGASVEIFVSASSSGEVKADSQGDFTFSNLTLSLGENSITARATDSNGNVSRVSETIVVVYNEPPAPPTGLAASAQDYNIQLVWDPNGEPDLSGYNLYKGDEKVNTPISLTSANTSANLSASSINYYFPPSNAFDSDLSTYWLSYRETGTFTPVWFQIELPTAELINHLAIHWYEVSDDQGNETLFAGKDYEVQVWSGYAWIPRAKVTENNARHNVFDFKPSYRTDKIRIYISLDTAFDYNYRMVGIREIEFLKEDLIPQASFEDVNLPDGQYGYHVTAVDYYGFESPSSQQVSTTVGDVVPPSEPQNLVATSSESNIVLEWSLNPEPDLAGYHVYRHTAEGWLKINTIIVTDRTYVDRNLRNGTYAYRVTSVDEVGNESPPSLDASAKVNVVPPQPPLNLVVNSSPEGKALRVTWEYAGDPVTGYNLYRSNTSQGPYTKINQALLSSSAYLDAGLINGLAYYYVVAAIDFAGNESAYSNEAMGIPSDRIPPGKPEIFFPTLSGIPIVLYRSGTDILGRAEPGSSVELFKDGAFVGKTTAPDRDVLQSFFLGSDVAEASLSPDGKTLAYRYGSYSYEGPIWLMALSSGQVIQILANGRAPLWSPDGSKIAYSFRDDNWYQRIGIYDVLTGKSAPLTDDAWVSEKNPSWSSDGNRIAFVSSKEGTRNVWVKDLVSGTLTQATYGNYITDARISPDGNHLAYFEYNSLSVVNLATGQVVAVDASTDGFSANWSSDSKRFAFVSYRNGNNDIFLLDVPTQGQVQMTDSNADELNPVWDPNGDEIVYGRSELDGSQSVWIASTQAQGQERLVQKNLDYLRYLCWVKSGEIGYIEASNLNVVSLTGRFRFEDVPLEVGENIFDVSATDESGNRSLPSEEISVLFDTKRIPDLGITDDDIFIYPPYPKEGVEAEIQVFVRNNGQVEAKGVDVDIYLWDSMGRMELVKSERIASIAPSSGEPVALSWDTTGKTGTNRVIVIVDPKNRIDEWMETNNAATREFYVVREEGLSMTTDLDAKEYASDQGVHVKISLRNSGIGKNVSLEVQIEDQHGVIVTSLDSIETYLPYASTQTYRPIWSTDSIYAGSYRVHTTLREGVTVITENFVSFTILPDINVGATLVTDRTSYDPNEKVTISLTVTNAGKNYAIPKMDARIRIVDRGGIDLFKDDQEIRNLLPYGSVTLNSVWNTGLQPPGDYDAMVEIYLDGQKISSQSVSFKVNASSVVTGHVTTIPQVVFLGHSVEANYTIQNCGNRDINDLGVKVLVVDSETQAIVNSYEDVINLIMNSAQTGKIFFSTEGYALKTYAIRLEYVYQGATKKIASTSFTVKDGTPPVVTILSPSPNQSFNSVIHVSAIATDLSSGIERAEYQVDEGSWRMLPVSDLSQGRYSITWSPTASDEGLRTISVRAIDRAGNTSLPVAVQITIDLTPPEAPMILSPPEGSSVTSEVVDIKGSAEPGATIEMVFAGSFKMQADPVTGEFIFAGVRLLPGTNSFIFTASDRVGNVSQPETYTLSLRIFPTGEVKTDRREYTPNEVVTIISAVENPNQTFMLQNLIARVSVTNSLGSILFTDERTILQIPPNGREEVVTCWNTAVNPLGTYGVKLEVFEGSVLLASATTSFRLRDPYEGLTGILPATTVYRGQDAHLTYTLTNAEEEDFADLSVRVTLVNPDTQNIEATLETTANLPRGKSLTGNLTISTSSLAPRAYLAILQVSLGGVTQPKTLASSVFIVIQAIALPFSDSFDSYPVAAAPPAPWFELCGVQAVTTSAESFSGQNSIITGGEPDQGHCAIVGLGMTYPERISYEVRAKVNEEKGSAFFGFFEEIADRVPQFNAVYFNGTDGKVYFYSADKEHGFLVPLSGSFAPGVWHKVRVEIDFSILTADVYIDGVLVGQGLPVSPREATWEYNGTHSFQLNKIGVLHYLGEPFYFDDFSVVEQRNRPPVADAGLNMVISGDTQHVTVIRGKTSDPDNDPLIYRWLEAEKELISWEPVGTNGECDLDLGSVTFLAMGEHILSLEVSDGKYISRDDMFLTVNNSAPHPAPAGGGVCEVNGQFPLKGQISDYDGEIVDYGWSEGNHLLHGGSIETLYGGTPVDLPEYRYPCSVPGDHTVTLWANDGVNQPTEASIRISVIDTSAPILAPVPDKNILWPPNHKMVTVSIQAHARDNSGSPVLLSAVISSNEPQNGLGDGDMSPDWTEPVIDQMSGVITLQLRAERSGGGNGRVYTIRITATDTSGNSSFGDVNIIVPRDQGKK